MTWTRAATGTGAVAILAMLLVAAMAIPASAASTTATRHQDRSTPPGHARFEGRHIDLTKGWGSARACVVWTRDGETDCYRSERAADAAVARRDRQAGRAAGASWTLASTGAHRDGTPSWHLQPASSCGDWLTLYEHSGHAGRSLRFRDRGYYQDLASWGFAYQTSSYRVGSCATTLRDGAWTSYPGWTGPGASASSMLSGWNDRVRYLRIS